jgi:hypothetical protein
MKVLHRARGWHAVWTGRFGVRSLPGDTPELVKALHELSDAGLLPPNDVTPPWARRAPCPRCGRLTVAGESDPPTVCCSCRADWVGRHVLWDRSWSQAVHRQMCESLGAPTTAMPSSDTEIEIPCLWCGLPLVARVVSATAHVLLHVIPGSGPNADPQLSAG